MNKMKILLLLCVFTVGTLVIMPGCGDTGKVIEDNKDVILATLKLTASKGTQAGLKKWSKSNPDAAKEAATALARNLKDQVLPYLDGEELKASAEVNEFINSSLFKDVPDEIKSAVVAAAEILDLYLPIPGSDKLNQTHVEYLKAFLTGVQEGAARFSGNLTVEKKERHWINGSNSDDSAVLQRSGNWLN